MKRKLAGMLLMDVNGTFDHVCWNYLLCTMDGIRADRHLMRKTELFMSDRRVGLIIDGH